MKRPPQPTSARDVGLYNLMDLKRLLGLPYTTCWHLKASGEIPAPTHPWRNSHYWNLEELHQIVQLIKTQER